MLVLLCFVRTILFQEKILYEVLAVFNNRFIYLFQESGSYVQ